MNISKKAKITISLIFLGATIVTSIVTTTAGVVIQSTNAKAHSLVAENEQIAESIQEKTSLTNLAGKISDAGFTKAHTVFASNTSLNASIASR